MPMRIYNLLYYKLKLRAFGIHSTINSPYRIEGANNIYIGDCVNIRYKAWLGAIPRTGSKICKLIIRDGCSIGTFTHIYATNQILLDKDVLLANYVYISDNIHKYEDINRPIQSQGIYQKKNVFIGEGSWLGEHVCVIGASIGKHCVIGANSVVTKDIPDYSVAVGSPARIIKRYDFKNGTWEKTDINGKFIND